MHLWSVIATIAFAIAGAAFGVLLWRTGRPPDAQSREGGVRPTAATRADVVLAIAGGAAFAGAAIGFEWSWRTFVLGPLAAVLIALAAIDARYGVIPNRITYPSLLVFACMLVILGATPASPDLPAAGIGFAAFGGGLTILALIAPKGMGMGDAKLAALIGLVVGALGLRLMAVAVAVGFLSGGIAAAVMLIVRRDRKATFPFGPYLAMGGVFAALIAPHLGWAQVRG